MTTGHRTRAGRRRRWTTVCLASFLLLAACGGDDGDGSSDDQSAAEGTGDDAAQDDTAGDEAGGSEEEAAGPAATSDFCGDLEAYVADSLEFYVPLFNGDADAARQAAGPLPEDAAAVALSAPPDLLADVEMINEELFRVTGALEAADYDLSAVDLAAADESVSAAEDRVNEYARTECGFDPEDLGEEGLPAETSDTGGDDGSEAAADAASGTITVETVADTCDEFTEVIAALRGEVPESVDSSAVTDVHVNSATYRSAECRWLYAGDEFTDQNRLSIQVNHADAMTPEQREQMWTILAVTEPVTGVGDEGQWYYSAAIDVSASARALVGDTVVILRTTVPDDLEGAPWIAKDPMVAALEDVLTIMAI